MSLISPRNFAAPFTNGVHLVAIILVALLFGLFRLTEGTIRVGARGEKPSPRMKIESSAVETHPRAVSAVGENSRGKFEPEERPGTQVAEEGDDILNQLIGKSQAEPSSPPQPSKKVRDKDLADIERKLGIRE